MNDVKLNKVVKLPKRLAGKPAIEFIINFRKKVTEEIQEVTLNADKLEFIDSGSIGFLVVEAMRLKRLGGCLIIIDLDKEIKENFLIATLDEIIVFKETDF